VNERYYPDLERRFGSSFWKGIWVDVRTLRGSIPLYSSGDANCCPSHELRLALSLRGRDLVISSARACATSSGPTAIDFYLAPDSYPMSAFYQERNGHFATATLSARTMSVKDEDFVDLDDEVHVLQDGFEPLALASHSSSLPYDSIGQCAERGERAK
jgi:hypothetical protein